MELRDLKVGDFVRTRYGIGKIDDTQMFMNKYFQVHLDTNKGKIYSVTDNTYWNDEEDIIKASDKLIDLVDIGDYVNGRKVYQVGYNFQDCYVLKMSKSNYEDFIYPNDIKSIITKEQFEQMSYKAGE